MALRFVVVAASCHGQVCFFGTVSFAVVMRCCTFPVHGAMFIKPISSSC